MTLAPKRRKFVREYVKSLNGTRAAIKAGYSPKSAAQEANRLLSNAQIRAAIAKAEARQISRSDITADRVLREVARLAYFDIGALVAADGRPIPVQKLPADVRACIASIEFIPRRLPGLKPGDPDIVEYVHKIKAHDKNPNLERLMRHLQLLGSDTEPPADAYAELIVIARKELSSKLDRLAGSGGASSLPGPADPGSDGGTAV